MPCLASAPGTFRWRPKWLPDEGSGNGAHGSALSVARHSDGAGTEKLRTRQRLTARVGRGRPETAECRRPGRLPAEGAAAHSRPTTCRQPLGAQALHARSRTGAKRGSRTANGPRTRAVPARPPPCRAVLPAPVLLAHPPGRPNRCTEHRARSAQRGSCIPMQMVAPSACSAWSSVIPCPLFAESRFPWARRPGARPESRQWPAPPPRTAAGRRASRPPRQSPKNARYGKVPGNRSTGNPSAPRWTISHVPWTLRLFFYAATVPVQITCLQQSPSFASSA